MRPIQTKVPIVADVRASAPGGRSVGGGAADDPARRAPQKLGEIAQWRAERRRALRVALAAVPPARMSDAQTRIIAALQPVIDTALAARPGRPLVGWRPGPGEPDLGALMQTLRARGTAVQIAIPARGQRRFCFVPWEAEGPGAEDVVPIFGGDFTAGPAPAVVLAPLLGWDDAGYRLGRGSGFYDRTLSRLPADTMLIGIGLERARLATIHPQPFDISMDLIITEAGVVGRAAARP